MPKAKQANGERRGPGGRPAIGRSPLADLTVRPSILAALLGVPERNVRAWAVEGLIELEPDGSYRLVPAVQNIVKHLRNEASQRPSLPKFNDARTRRANADAEMREMKLAKMRSNLWETSQVDTMIFNIVDTFRNYLLSLKSRFSQRLPHLTVNDLREIDAVIREVMGEIAKPKSGAAFEEQIASVNKAIKELTGQQLLLIREKSGD